MRSQMIGSVSRSAARTTSTPPARPVQRPRADAGEVGEERAEARAPLEVPEEARVRRVRVVDDRRGRARLVRDEQVHPEAVEPRRVLGVVVAPRAIVAAPARCSSSMSTRSSQSSTSACCTRSSQCDARRRRAARSASTSAFIAVVDDAAAAALRERLLARRLELAALCARTSCAAFSTSRVSLPLGLGRARASSTRRARRTARRSPACRGGSGTSARRRGPARTPKPSVFASDSSWWMTCSFLRLELAARAAPGRL